ncbi:MAG: hypothetical protein Q9M48_05850 [Rhodobacterales bacterium]|nr:hypothetical protein [Rhodobacterales bacterium]
MSFREEHELHKRRFGRNVGLGVVLGSFVALVFGLTIAKVTSGDLAIQPAPQSVSQNEVSQ